MTDDATAAVGDAAIGTPRRKHHIVYLSEAAKDALRQMAHEDRHTMGVMAEIIIAEALEAREQARAKPNG